MWGRLKSSVIADMKIISHDGMLLLLSLSPLLLIILLRLIFPLVSRLIFTRSGFLIDRYYSLTAITFVSIIPMLFGMVYAFIHLDENDLSVIPEQKEKPANRSNLLLRIIVTHSSQFYYGSLKYSYCQSRFYRGMVKNWLCDISFIYPIPICIFSYLQSCRKQN